MTVDGGSTKESIEFLYRDGLELFQFLYGIPIFADMQKHVPEKVWADFEKEIRMVDKPMTGDFAWKIQVCSSLCLPLS